MAAVLGNKLDSVLTSQAVAALFKWEEQQKSKSGKQHLVGDYAKPVLVQLFLKAVIKKPVKRPVRILIPHSLFSVEGEDHSMCLFCKSSEKKAIEEHMAKHPVPGLDKILSIDEVRKHYHIFKDQKKLLSEHTHFMCDANIYPQLVNLLGKTFSARNPTPINFKSPATIADALNKATSSSYMQLKGSTITIRFGHTAMNVAQVTANIMEGLQFAVPKLVKGWKDVHSIHLKTPKSPTLPIFSKVPSESMTYMKEQSKAASKTGAKETVTAKGGNKGETKGEKKSGEKVVAVESNDVKGKKGKASDKGSVKEAASTVVSGKKGSSVKAVEEVVVEKAPVKGKDSGKVAVKAATKASGKATSDKKTEPALSLPPPTTTTTAAKPTKPSKTNAAAAVAPSSSSSSSSKPAKNVPSDSKSVPAVAAGKAKPSAASSKSTKASKEAEKVEEEEEEVVVGNKRGRANSSSTTTAKPVVAKPVVAKASAAKEEKSTGKPQPRKQQKQQAPPEEEEEEEKPVAKKAKTTVAKTAKKGGK